MRTVTDENCETSNKVRAFNFKLINPKFKLSSPKVTKPSIPAIRVVSETPLDNDSKIIKQAFHPAKDHP